MNLYDHPAVYDERFSEAANTAYRRHYQRLFAGCGITDILDCSFGTGCLTFCLCELGYQVFGSDISRAMLDRAQEKAAEKRVEVDLLCCDFRELSRHFSRTFSCVMSTGNALAHVCPEDVRKTLREMDRLVRPGGYLYFDSRNWEKELAGRERFKMGQPFFGEDGCRINYVQVWDYHENGSVTVNILNAYEKQGRITRQEVYEETLYPFAVGPVREALVEMGYTDIQIRPFPWFSDMDFADMGWYCLLARKPG